MDELGDQGEGILIQYHPLVQFLVVLDWSKLSVLLFDEEEAACIWEFRVTDPLEAEVGCEEFLLFLMLLR